MFNTRARRVRQRFVRSQNNNKVRCSKFESPATIRATKACTWLDSPSTVSRCRSDIHDLHTRKNVFSGCALGTNAKRKIPEVHIKIADRSTIHVTSLMLNNRCGNARMHTRTNVNSHMPRQNESTTGLRK